MYRGDGKVYNQGTHGYFWSAGSDSATSARNLSYYGNYTDPENSIYKTHGLSVRCDQGSTRVNDILHKFPFSLPYTGYINTTGKAGPFDGGNFWTNAADAAISTYAFSFWSTKVYPARSSASPETNTFKTYGFTVRHVVKVGDQGSTRVNDILHKFPFSLPYSGYVNRDSGATVYQGTYGLWWSAGSNSSTYARYLAIGGNNTNPEHDNYKTHGFSVRCVVFCGTGLRPKPPLFLKAIKADFTLGG